MGRAEAPEAPESRFPCALPPPAVLSPAATCAPPLPATPEPSAASLALEGWLLAPEAGALISLRVAPSPRTERAPAGPAREGLPAWSPSVSRRVERAQPGRMTSPAAAQSREIDCLSPEAQRLAEARLAAKRAARAEAREIRMKELERQQKEIYQVQKKYYGLDTKWGDIEQWMEDSERYSRRSRRNTSASDEDERMSVGSRGSLRSQPDLEYGGPYAWTNGYDGELYGSQSLNRRAGRNSSYSSDSRFSTLSSSREEKLGLSGSSLGLPGGGLAPTPLSAPNGNWPSCLYSAARPSGSYRASVLDEGSFGGARRGSISGSRAPSEYSGHLNSSSRASSRASSARASPVVEDRPEKDFTEKGSRNMPGLSAATLASLGGTSSRRGSGDTSISIDTEASIREIKDSLAEVEEKYKKAMVSNAQLDNEKTNFMYQVDTLKDMMLELEEQLAESRRQYEEKNKEFEREKHAHSILQFQFAEVKEALKQREEMLEKHGIILNSEIATNGETSDTLNNFGYQGPSKMTKEELNALKSTGDGTLDIRLKKLVDERECLLEQIKKLKGQLEERQKIGKLDNLRSEDDVLENGTDMHVMDLQRDANRQISDLKFKLAKSEQEITALEQNVIRLESQVSRYKSAAENAEKIEDELKAEKRKLQRELRSALDKTEELEVSNGHLVKRLEKMKANRSALLSQQ
ncbi:leucine-rich repeat flightless-interacting protein 1 isoform X43 [Trachypithecus francoisi]|uniref:leucine-rich repeat flightless-interacting protein 1 isoform X43 n=1 Tax=Trachypithecus francoisi TaxID=54180 RepID=UPI00141B36D2|nr:leucine-rich repeat flightless-interacting protein 1 isoform X43 [Trachypithecus francoisi]